MSSLLLDDEPSQDEPLLQHDDHVPRTSSPPPSYEAKEHPKKRPSQLSEFFGGLFALGCIVLAALPTISSMIRRDPLPQAVHFGTAAARLVEFQSSLDQCAALQKFPARMDTINRESNPRWNAVTGQSETTILRNATLFDGEKFIPHPVDIVFEKGLILSVSASGTSGRRWAGKATEYNLDGQWVTPGLVDMHSHHTIDPWPMLPSNEDANEIHPDSGPLTPFVRTLDGMKAYDVATTLIASGGVTSSLVIPGSANIMGGEGTVVKNRNRSGPNRELVVEELLLEYGIPVDERHRYLKMACGENPKRLYGHTRMGNAWVLRKHLARAKALLKNQDAWCAAAATIWEYDTKGKLELLELFGGGFPEELELDSTVGLLRGRVAMHNHCYEPHDMETMLRISKEFGFSVRAFHHSIAAWQVPEMIKEYGGNVTIATFAEFGLYKWEAYAANLYAGKIIHEHGLPLAYKSDHSSEPTNAKYLLNQAATAHSFHLPADIALQSVTSVPAKAIDLDDRIGYLRTGYDADIVVWDAHPLSVGATPRQVFIDGVATLDPLRVKEAMDDRAPETTAEARRRRNEEPRMRATIAEDAKQDVCKRAGEKNQRFVVTGIHSSFLDRYPELASVANENQARGENMTLVISGGRVDCLGSSSACRSQIAAATTSGAVKISLSDGYLAPGLTAVTATLGLQEILLEESTGNGEVSPFLDPLKEASVDFAKFGLVLKGKSFVRAQMGGVTRAVTPPMSIGGILRGVSAGFLTSGKRTLLDGGIFLPNVAMHFDLGSLNKVSPGSVSYAVKKLREVHEAAARAVQDGRPHESLYAPVVRDFIPVVVHAKNEVCGYILDPGALSLAGHQRVLMLGRGKLMPRRMSEQRMG